MVHRELTEREKEQRRKLNERFRGRVMPKINILDIGHPWFDEYLNIEEESIYPYESISNSLNDKGR